MEPATFCKVDVCVHAHVSAEIIKSNYVYIYIFLISKQKQWKN